MSDVQALLKRIDDEFAASERRVKEFQSEQVQAYEERQKRLEIFEKRCDELRQIWQPRLEALVQKFGDKVQVKPTITRGLREAAFSFESGLAHIDLSFRASTDQDVRKLVLDYRLEILPILMKFEPHRQAEFPLEQVEAEKVALWIDERILEFVRTYLSLHQNELYLKDHMVVDPVAGIRFPKYAAASTLDVAGQMFYFIDEKTRAEFERRQGFGG